MLSDISQLNGPVKAVLTHFDGMGHGLDGDLLSKGWSEWERFCVYWHSKRGQQTNTTSRVRKCKDANGVTLKKPIVTLTTSSSNTPVHELLTKFLSVAANHIEFPILVLLILIYLVFAIASADAERAFNQNSTLKSYVAGSLAAAYDDSS